MAKVSKEKEKLAKRKIKKIDILPLEAVNYKILISGVVIVILGYVALGMEPWDGFMALTVAPVLLLFGYCIVIPFGIIYRRKKTQIAPPTAEQTTGAVPQS
jgi:hypothetical protein